LLHFLGLSGVLNWSAIPNQSALGAGLWFFTLLLMFYLSYPYLAKLCQSKSATVWTALAATAGAVLLQQRVHMGHELWLTALGFILGVGYGLHEPKFRSRYVFFMAGLLGVGLLGINLFSSYKQFNTILIAATSICISLWLSKAVLPNWSVLKLLARFEKYLLEIFVMHTYLFMHFLGHSVLDFAVSLLLIVIAAIAINHVVMWMSSLIFESS
jgi:hypothetical protein